MDVVPYYVQGMVLGWLRQASPYLGVSIVLYITCNDRLTLRSIAHVGKLCPSRASSANSFLEETWASNSLVAIAYMFICINLTNCGVVKLTRIYLHM